MDSNSDNSLDHFTSTEPPPALSINQHLSYPSLDPEEESTRPDSSSQSQGPTLFKDRIYVGNLHPSVDEYTLVQVFSKFGEITSVDYLFHKAGPLKGKPRGYAFVKYANETDAQKAMSVANDKVLRGRKIVVTYAHHAPLNSMGGSSGKGRRAMMEVGRPTTLSLLKSGSTSRPIGTAAKIAKMEAKLRQLESSSDTPQNAPSLHPSLPPKPQGGPKETNPQSNSRPKSFSSSTARRDEPSPTLVKLTSSSPPISTLPSSSLPSKPNKKTKLLGVKIKPKEKDKAEKTPATEASKLD